MVYYARIMCIKIISFYCAVNMHLEKLWTIYRSSVLKNGSKIWFLAFLTYRCDHFFFSNRFMWSFYLAFTNGFDQKKTSSYWVFIFWKHSPRLFACTVKVKGGKKLLDFLKILVQVAQILRFCAKFVLLVRF